MPRVLIVTYYWPPSGGSAVLRWLKFVKYLRDFGWEPVVYTPSNPEPQEIDPSLVKDLPDHLEVLTSRIWEPYTVYKWLTGRKKGDRLGVALMSDNRNPGFLSKMSLWIRSNFFIPDPRCFWIRPSVKYLSNYLRNKPVTAVITTGPPHSMHLIGLGLKRKMGIKWVADFRDPWTNIDFYRDLDLTCWADRRHRALERKVLHSADEIITVSPGMTREFSAMGVNRVTTITNGFDILLPAPANPVTGKFSLVHLGSIPKSRNPESLWKALSEMIRHSPDFADNLHIRLIGKTDHTVKDSVKLYELMDYVSFEDYLPHEKTFTVLAEAAVLLLFINNTPNAGSILTNKFFEYLSAHRPILAIGPVEGDVSVILSETGAGKIVGYNDIPGLKDQLFNLFELYSQHNLITDSRGIERFSRRNLTGELVELLNQLVS